MLVRKAQRRFNNVPNCLYNFLFSIYLFNGFLKLCPFLKFWGAHTHTRTHISFQQITAIISKRKITRIIKSIPALAFHLDRLYRKSRISGSIGIPRTQPWGYYSYIERAALKRYKHGLKDPFFCKIIPNHIATTNHENLQNYQGSFPMGRLVLV